MTRVGVMSALGLVLLGGALAPALGCGAELVNATFTSRVVQLEVCTTRGDRPETCQQAETLLDLRVELEEREDGSVWLRGVPRAGVSDRAVLGARAEDGAFLFVEELTKSNGDTECTVTERLEIAVQVDPAAAPESVGTDSCVALIGREYLVTSSSPGCDSVNDPALSETRIARRRWQPSPLCDDAE